MERTEREERTDRRQVRESGEARRRNGRGKEVSEREGKAAEERTV